MSTDSLVGALIGNYLIKELLGKGGMGSVYLAEHPRIGRKVAVKVMSSAITQQPDAAERFEAEARLITRIEHPNVIEIFDFGAMDDGSLYYVMELLKGQELADVMDEGKMSAAEAAPYVEQICAALQAAHDHGVVHRDLKPQNIFVLDRDPLAIKILDFGIAKLLETEGGAGLTQTGMVMGTPRFIAPEQAAGEPGRIGPHTDIYSLGVILYAMLSGQPPFTDSAPGILLAKHIYEEPPSIRSRDPAVPTLIANVVHHCMLKAPEERPESAVAVDRAYKDALNEVATVQASADITNEDTLPQRVLGEPKIARVNDSQAGSTTMGGSTGEISGAQDGNHLSHARSGMKMAGAAMAATVLLTLGAVVLFSRGKDNATSTTSAAQPASTEVGHSPGSTGALQGTTLTKTRSELDPAPAPSSKNEKNAIAETADAGLDGPASVIKKVAPSRRIRRAARGTAKKTRPALEPAPIKAIEPAPIKEEETVKILRPAKKESSAGSDVVDVKF